MNKLFILFGTCSLLLVFACDNSQEDSAQSSQEEATLVSVENASDETTPDATAQDGNLPVMSFEEIEFDFGTTNEGEIVKHDFIFTNTGEAPLVIDTARASCGCTIPTFPREPIAPGETGTIAVEFNSQGRPGITNKSIRINANTQPEVTVLYLKGTVKQMLDMKGPRNNQ